MPSMYQMSRPEVPPNVCIRISTWTYETERVQHRPLPSQTCSHHEFLFFRVLSPNTWASFLTPLSLSPWHSVTLRPTPAILPSLLSKSIPNLSPLSISVTTVLLPVMITSHTFHSNLSSSLTASTLSPILKTEAVLKTDRNPKSSEYDTLLCHCSHLGGGCAPR